MDNEKLKLIAMDINALLNKYIDIDYDLKRRSTGLLSIFKSVQFENIKNKLGNIIELLEVKKQELENINIDDISEIQSKFIQTMNNYVSALVDSVKLLYEMVNSLFEKSKGSNGEKISFSKHRINTQQHNDSMQNYLQYGQKLNDLFDSLD